jgi:hypothetical protein
MTPTEKPTRQCPYCSRDFDTVPEAMAHLPLCTERKNYAASMSTNSLIAKPRLLGLRTGQYSKG